MTEIVETEIIPSALNDGQIFQASSPEMSTEGVAGMNGYIAVRITAAGRKRHLWQEVRGGVVMGMVDRNGKTAKLSTAFEAQVIDGILRNSPGSKGEDA